MTRIGKSISDREILYWAVIGRYRFWLNFDGAELRRIGRSGQRLDGYAVRRIAREYQVNRTILRKKDGGRGGSGANDQAADRLAKALKQAAARWPSTLEERAKVCARIAEKAGTRNGGNQEDRTRRAVSAVTKLMWFLKPHGWTVFDNLAATGLGIRAFPDRTKRMKFFYRGLKEGGFEPLARKVNRHLKGTSFAAIRGERVIDRYLMFKGAEQRKRDGTNLQTVMIDEAKQFMALLPARLRSELHEVADKISRDCIADILCLTERDSTARRRSRGSKASGKSAVA